MRVSTNFDTIKKFFCSEDELLLFQTTTTAGKAAEIEGGNVKKKTIFCTEGLRGFAVKMRIWEKRSCFELLYQKILMGEFSKFGCQENRLERVDDKNRIKIQISCESGSA